MISTCRVMVGVCVAVILAAATLVAGAKGNGATPAVPLNPEKQFDHVGFITTEKKPNETFVAATKVWVTDIPSHPFRVEWLRFEPDSPVKGPVREKPHVAFRVDSIAGAAAGMKVLIEPFDAGIARVGFYEAEDGAVVEFMEYHKKPKE